jgi:hypothetical protein
MLCIFNADLPIFNTCLESSIHYYIFLIHVLVFVGTILSLPETQVTRKKNHTLVSSFKVPTKIQVDTKSPQSHKKNPTLTKTCVFQRVGCRVYTWLSFTSDFSPAEWLLLLFKLFIQFFRYLGVQYYNMGMFYHTYRHLRLRG